MRGAFHTLAALVFAWFAIFAGAAARAESAPHETCIARLPTGQTAEQVIARPQDFDCKIKQNALGSGDFVVRMRFAPTHSDSADPHVLRMSSVWLKSARATFRYADGSQAEFAFASHDITKVLTIGAIFELPVPVRSADLETVFLEAHGAGNMRGVVLGPRLMTRSESQTWRVQLTIIYSVFGGLALALIVYNLALWATLRHRFQLYYCGMVAALAAYAFSSSGLLNLVMPQVDNTVRLRCNYITLALAGVIALQFVRHFFGGRIIGRKLDRAILVISAVAFVSALAVIVFAPWQLTLLDRFYFLAMMAVICLIPPMLLQAWRAKSPYFVMVLAAWSAPLIISILRSLHGVNLIDYSFWLDNGNVIAFALEALVSSVLVTARLRELSYERDHARAGEEVARRLAATDPLTGLPNRRAFLDLAIGRKSRQRLMLIDIDHFKAVNDRLGHAGGDEVLHAIAQAIQGCRPARSLAVRLGGEEFALLLPASAIADCTANKVLDAVRSCTMPQALQVTVSVGFADGSVASEDDWKRLYRLADTALYRAKSDGRDRACRATDFRAVA